MNKKLIFKYVLLYVPFILGLGLFSFGILNLFSSLLLFLGGYIAIKNTFDYRKVRKNIDSVKIENDEIIKKEYVPKRTAEQIPGFKRTRRYERVRKRVKY